MARLGSMVAVTLVLGLGGGAAHAQWPFNFGAKAEETKSPAEVAATVPLRVYKLDGALREKTSPWDIFQSDGGHVFPELVASLRADARSATTKTILVQIGGLALGPAQAQELGQALAAAKAAKKRVVVYLERPDLLTLVAAAPADLIAMTPESAAFVPGLRAEVSFYKDLLTTIGVEADIESVGQYKSAMEPYTRTALSDAAKENLESLIDGIYRGVVKDIAMPRRLDAAKVEAAIDEGLLTAERAKAARLVDELRYWGELVDDEKRVGAAAVAWPKPPDTPELGSILDLFKLLGGDEAKPADTTPKVAVLVAEGPIVEGADPSDLMSSDNVVASEDFLDALHTIENDPTVKALVVRIDSPGGSALASDLIWRELDRVDKKIPVIASLGNVAASGGYYIAAAARRIYADATTLTGSIGVFGGKMVYGGLLDKIGVHTTIISRGKNAGLFSGLTRFSESERAVMRESMQHTYKTFVNRVAKGRNMSFDAVDKVAQGRVWTGAQALEVGLVDKLGGLDEAIAEAARVSKAWSAGSEPKVELFPKKKTLMDLFGKGAADAKRIELGGRLASLAALARTLPAPIAGPSMRLARVVEALVGKTPILAMMPMAIEIR